MALRDSPAGNGAGGLPPRSHRDHFTDLVTKNAYVPMWVHPHTAAGLLRHFGGEGLVLVHPHPASGHPAYASGGVVTPQAQGGPDYDQRVPPEIRPPPAAAAARPTMPPIGRMPPGQMPPLAGIRPTMANPIEKRSIFAGGPIGFGGPTDRTPVFAQSGSVMDARPGGKVPGSTPGPNDEHDTQHAMLDPGEAVFNPKQLAGIKPKPGKEHLLRADQKKAMRKASKRAR